MALRMGQGSRETAEPDWISNVLSTKQLGLRPCKLRGMARLLGWDKDRV